jgi:hypothetical protein
VPGTTNRTYHMDRCSHDYRGHNEFCAFSTADIACRSYKQETSLSKTFLNYKDSNERHILLYSSLIS